MTLDTIHIDNLRAYAILGIHPHERTQRQPVVLNAQLHVDTRPAAHSDAIQDAVDYATLTDRLVAHLEASSDQLIERLLDDLVRLIFAEFPAVQRLRLRLDKPAALRFADSVGIEVERSRADLTPRE